MQVTLDIIVSTGIVSNMTTHIPDYYYNSSLAHCVYNGSTITRHGHEHLHAKSYPRWFSALLTYEARTLSVIRS